MSLNSSDWIQNTELAHSAAYIRIVNNSTNGIYLYNGSISIPCFSLNGSQMVNAGKAEVFPINMNLVGGSYEGNAEYAEYTEYTQYCVGNAVIDKTYLTNNTNSIGDSFKFYAGKLYEVEINSDGSSYGVNINLSWMDSSSDVEF